MCELLAIASSYPYKANKAIPAFAVLGQHNADGWGICHFRNNKAIIQKSSHAAFDGNTIDRELEVVSKQAEGNVIIGHVRYTSSGITDSCHSHPFVLDFLNQDWAFIHNGTCHDIESYRTKRKRLKNVTSDSARIFEFLRDKILTNNEKLGFKAFELFSAVEHAALDLLNTFDGGYNFMLTNGKILFSFSHHRPFWLLHRSKLLGDATLLTTIDHGLTDGENWHSIGDYDSNSGYLFMYVNDLCILRSDLYKGM